MEVISAQYHFNIKYIRKEKNMNIAKSVNWAYVTTVQPTDSNLETQKSILLLNTTIFESNIIVDSQTNVFYKERLEFKKLLNRVQKGDCIFIETFSAISNDINILLDFLLLLHKKNVLLYVMHIDTCKKNLQLLLTYANFELLKQASVEKSDSVQENLTLQIKNSKNPRKAGRKTVITESLIQNIKKQRLENPSMSTIETCFTNNISIPTFYKLKHRL
jgi:DNA invertase Pin-like site-specific DNA recombinase